MSLASLTCVRFPRPTHVVPWISTPCLIYCPITLQCMTMPPWLINPSSQWAFVHFLTVISNVTKNVHVQVYLDMSSYGNSALLFEKTPNSFTKWLSHYTFLPALHRGCNFSTSLSTLVIICLFDYTHLSGLEMISHGEFWYAFP